MAFRPFIAGAAVCLCFGVKPALSQSGYTVYGPLAVERSLPTESTVIRQWNEDLLEAIRGDFARPTVHARNLFHFSLACFDAFAAYDDVDSVMFLGQDFHGYDVPFDPFLLEIPQDPEALRLAQETAISLSLIHI